METTPSSLNLIIKAFQLSFTNIWRNKFLSIATIFVIGIILFIFNIILAINFIAKDSINNLSKKIDLVIYLKESTTFENGQNIAQDLENLPGIIKVSYISKQKAMEEIQKTYPNISDAFEKYNLGNPLPASINITTTNPKYHEEILNFLKQNKYSALLSNTINQTKESTAIMESVSKNLIKLSEFAHQIIFWLIIAFVIGGSLITLNALQITIFTRKKEIKIMKLVGASYWFIKLPFIIEGILYGISAIIFSFIILFFMSKSIHIQNLDISNYTNINFLTLSIAELLITIILTVASSMIAVHEHLSTKNSM